MELKTNSQIELAREFLLSTGSNIFLTGRAGTGKTTFLRNIVKSINKRTVVAAPTGVAALNAGGVTLHSLFQLPFSPHIPNQPMQFGGNNRAIRLSKNKLALIRTMELLVIDEVSMVRADTLDAVDSVLRMVRRNELRFGGVQLLMIGDIQQLSPICKDEEWQLLREHYRTPYFFDSQALSECNYITLELQEIFRQVDIKFTELLNAVRDNRLTREIIAQLNERYIPNFEPPKDEHYITLSAYNNTVNSINRLRLDEIDSSSTIYKATTSGEFPEAIYPINELLELKVGAQVIFTKNDPSPEKLYYNGLIGKVIELRTNSVIVLPNGAEEPIVVTIVAWNNVDYAIDSTSGEIVENIKGTFSQIPLKCAWAITIHKSQGLSFDKAIIDAGNSFAYGQVYVALSRCRTLEGMVLSSPISQSAIKNDISVASFSNYISNNQPDTSKLEEHKRLYYITTLTDIFSFEALTKSIKRLSDTMNINLLRQYPKLCNNLFELSNSAKDDIQKVGDNFRNQLARILGNSSNYQQDEIANERLSKASIYFTDKLDALFDLLVELSKVKPDAKEVKSRLKRQITEFAQELSLKNSAIKLCAEPFNLEEYHKQRVKILMGDLTSGKSKKPTTKSQKAENSDSDQDIIHQELYDNLRAWRKMEGEEQKKPLYTIVSNKCLMSIQSMLPSSIAELKEVPGIGDIKAEKYGEQILDIVRDYLQLLDDIG